MKKLLLLLPMMAFAIGLSAQKNVPLDQIRDGWQSKNLEVNVNDNQQANILQLVAAFQQGWPTYSGGELLKFAKSQEKYDNTDKVVDLKNGFVRYSEDDPDAESDEYLEACVWNRKNGHKLFAITVFHMTPSELVVLCFYDYDPKTKALTPEKGLTNLFTPSFPWYRYRVWLPQQGKDLEIQEFLGGVTITHTYGWDGMKPSNPKTMIEEMDRCWGPFRDNYYFGDGNNLFTQYALTDIDNDGIPEMILQSDNEEFRAVYSTYPTLKLLSGENGSRFLSFYKNAVCHSGSCGALCMSAEYVILKNSVPNSYLREESEWDNQIESYGESNYFLDGKEISREKGENMVRSLGEPYEPKLKWTKLAVE